MSLTPERIRELSALCRRFRVEALTAIHGVQSGHPGGSLSACEILTLLYQEKMNLSADRLDDPDRDRLVLCKGHAAPMLYCNLIEKGILPRESLATLRRVDSELQGHPCNSTPGVEMPAGPLGIGLGAAEGMALALRLNGSPARVYAILGDGELDEGAVWEAAASSARFRLANLTAIVDWNKFRLDSQTSDFHDLCARWNAYGWNVLRCDGHNLAAINGCIDAAAAWTRGPSVIIADTIKGKGVSVMEGVPAWHGQAIDEKTFATAMAELGGAQ